MIEHPAVEPRHPALRFESALAERAGEEVMVTFEMAGDLEAFALQDRESGTSRWTWGAVFLRRREPRSRSTGYQLEAFLERGTWTATFHNMSFGNEPLHDIRELPNQPAVSGSRIVLRFPREWLDGLDSKATWQATTGVEPSNNYGVLEEQHTTGPMPLSM